MKTLKIISASLFITACLNDASFAMKRRSEVPTEILSKEDGQKTKKQKLNNHQDTTDEIVISRPPSILEKITNSVVSLINYNNQSTMEISTNNENNEDKQPTVIDKLAQLIKNLFIEKK